MTEQSKVEHSRVGQSGTGLRTAEKTKVEQCKAGQIIANLCRAVKCTTGHSITGKS